MNHTVNKGKHFEALALNFLAQKGLRLIAKNYTVRLGEIDLIMQDEDTLVFIEVRMRKKTSFATALESITEAKQKKLIRAALCFLRANPVFQDTLCRFDVVAIDHLLSPKWIKNAFTL